MDCKRYSFFTPLSREVFKGFAKRKSLVFPKIGCKKPKLQYLCKQREQLFEY